MNPSPRIGRTRGEHESVQTNSLVDARTVLAPFTERALVTVFSDHDAMGQNLAQQTAVRQNAYIHVLPPFHFLCRKILLTT